MKGHWNGPKHAGNHTTLTPQAQILVKGLEKLPEVIKISPGFINPRANAKKLGIRMHHIPAGLKIKVLGKGTQELTIYTDQPEKVESWLNAQ